MKLGAHVSIAGGIDKAPSCAYEIGCECFQIFTRSPHGGTPSKLDRKTVEAFLRECSRLGFPDYYVHTPYFINLASEEREIRSFSVSTIREEIQRGDIIGARFVVTHIGSARAFGRDSGISRAIEGIRRILDRADHRTKLLLENSAGQGALIGGTFEELARILEGVGHPDLGVCLDTAHLFASGYDIRTREAVKRTLKGFSSIVGLDKLKLLHGNDSKAGLGERRDRHEHIGKGKIGLEGFATILNDPHLKGIDLVIETPLKRVEDDIENLRKLRKLRI